VDKESVINEIIALHREHMGDDYNDKEEKKDRDRLADFNLEQCLKNLDDCKRAYEF
jgi:hypothetical protein